MVGLLRLKIRVSTRGLYRLAARFAARIMHCYYIVHTYVVSGLSYRALCYLHVLLGGERTSCFCVYCGARIATISVPTISILRYYIAKKNYIAKKKLQIQMYRRRVASCFVVERIFARHLEL